MKKVILILLCSVAMASCIIPKEARQLKKDTKEWRESLVLLHAYADSPFSGAVLTLRENGKLEHTSSGLLKSFSAGEWTNKQDTVELSYLDNNHNVTHLRKVFIDKKTSTLKFDRDSTSVFFRLRIMTNQLKNK
ncbi:MAG: hypothetical protein ACJAZ2_000828 [Glaciecola sp.]|jgi:hypothetical protein